MADRVEYPLRHYQDGDGNYLGGFAGLANPPPGAILMPGPPSPTWQDKRRDAIRERLLNDKTLADIIEVLVLELIARGASASPGFTQLLKKINDIRDEFPRP